MWAAMKKQFEEDRQNLQEGNAISLLAKWIKTADASSEKTRMLGILTAQKLGYSVYEFKRLVRAMRKQIGIVFVPDGFRLEFGKTFHEPIGSLIVHLEKVFKLFSCFCLLLFVLCKAGQKRNDQLGLQPRTEFSALIKVRASENAMIHVHIFPLDQLSHKAAP